MPCTFSITVIALRSLSTASHLLKKVIQLCLLGVKAAGQLGLDRRTVARYLAGETPRS
ncbi:hypothetical protein KH017_20750 [bacterium]|nr:hypothetical protein [bacterium]